MTKFSLLLYTTFTFYLPLPSPLGGDKGGEKGGKMRKVIYTSTLLIFAGFLNAEPIDLSYDFQPGQVFKYQFSSFMRTTIEVGGEARTIETKTNLFTTQKVDSIVEDSIIVLSLTVDKIELEVRPETPISGIEEIEGKEVKLRITESGEILETEGADQIQIMGQPGEQILDGYLKGFFEFLPDKPVKLKDTWEKKREDEEGSLTGKYTLIGMEEKEGYKCAKIKLEQELVQEQTQEEMENEIHTKITGKAKGEIYWGITKKALIYRTIAFSLEGTQGISGPQLAEPVSLPLYMDQTQEIKLLPEE